MARLLRGNRSHIDGAAQVWTEATAFRAAPERYRPTLGVHAVGS
jgi:hypothetical protein